MSLQNKRIYIIEDSTNARAIMQTLLEQAGAVVGFDRWGRETTERLLTFAPVDGVVLDLLLPNDVSGFDVFDEIRSVPQFARLPIIAVSAIDSVAALPRAKEMGFAGYIAKPIQILAFADQVASALAGMSVWIA